MLTLSRRVAGRAARLVAPQLPSCCRHAAVALAPRCAPFCAAANGPSSVKPTAATRSQEKLRLHRSADEVIAEAEAMAEHEGNQQERTTTVVYASPESKMLRALSYCCSATGFMGALGSTLTAWGFLSSGLNVTALTVLDGAQFGLGGALAVGSVYLTRWFTSSIVTTIYRHHSEGKESLDELTIETMQFPWGSRRTTYPRQDVLGSPGSTIRQCVEVVDNRSKGRYRKLFLAPLPGWVTEDHDYLKCLLYEHYFLPETPRPPDSTLIAIEGFGPYRPAQIADPTHAMSKGLAFNASEEEVAALGYRLDAKGQVVADFRFRPTQSIEDKRRENTLTFLNQPLESEGLLPASTVVPGKRMKEIEELYPRTEASHQEFIAIGDYTPAIAGTEGGEEEARAAGGGRDRSKEVRLRSVYRRERRWTKSNVTPDKSLPPEDK